jgi:hypothetical protein
MRVLNVIGVALIVSGILPALYANPNYDGTALEAVRGGDPVTIDATCMPDKKCSDLLEEGDYGCNIGMQWTHCNDRNFMPCVDTVCLTSGCAGDNAGPVKQCLMPPHEDCTEIQNALCGLADKGECEWDLGFVEEPITCTAPPHELWKCQITGCNPAQGSVNCDDDVKACQ